ncbi:possible alpha/beta hydrolase superfamily [Geminocystis sp. NIES-3708]|uniref:alpha/beta hydrolase n=1 Tax=Geminocystis sp. NIES-3708 TaxID=1615909 RepID=UPI0005FCB443|nr:alpha/beta fold hydrolase [Geminocystis sp. NIES-3708]BAQ62129.1 possible alpha/beta hydrolase superfamily [Geminocystis sp. NIES-3708]
MNNITVSQNINPIVKQYSWQWKNSAYSITFETQGEGKPILLLPAFSTVSSRTEMRGIAQLLSSQHQTNSLDWLGFGASDRPPLDYNPEIYEQLLVDFITNNFSEPVVIITAGHSAGYALKFTQCYPNLVDKIILIAPTGKGPLKVMGFPDNVRKIVKNLVYTPIIGQFLYYLNTTPAFLRFMYRRHVFVDESKLTPSFIKEKQTITQQKGARFAPSAFVTGNLDPINNSQEFLNLISQIQKPILNIIGNDSPPYSLSQMKAISQLDNVKTVTLEGTLGMAEEFANLIVPSIREFI